MTRQESLQKILKEIYNARWIDGVADNVFLSEMDAIGDYAYCDQMDEIRMDIAELLILRYYECGGE